MRKLILAAIAISLLAMPLAQADEVPEGCVASKDPATDFTLGKDPSCEYIATAAGNVVGFGQWKVEVWWSGICGNGTPNWVREAPKDNNLVNSAAWEGAIAAGSCARATAKANGSFVAIGEVRQLLGETPEIPEAPEVPEVPEVPELPDVPGTPGGELETELGCVAVATTEAASCQVVAGTEDDETIHGDGALRTGGRASFVAHGEWTVDVYPNDTCSGSPARTFSSSDDGTNIPDPSLPGAYGNNGGVFYGRCAIATAHSAGSWVAMGPITSDLLP